jgi:hypothetical protein
MRKLYSCAIGTLLLLGASSVVSTAEATVLYSNGFETDVAGWITPSRVPSGTNGVPSQSGGFHAETSRDAGDFTRWGGYNYGAGSVPTVFQEYWTELGIYLDIAGGWANGTQFDFSSAISNSAGFHRRDFVFTGGFYNSLDMNGPGAGTNRFNFTASNNAPGWAQNPGRSPIAISASGWYTFEHHFYDNAGVLAVDMTIYDSAHLPLSVWTLSDPSDVIGVIGGNRYGWFVDNGFSRLAIDNTQLRTKDASVPEPSPIALISMALLALFGLGLMRRRAEA